MMNRNTTVYNCILHKTNIYIHIQIMYVYMYVSLSCFQLNTRQRCKDQIHGIDTKVMLTPHCVCMWKRKRKREREINKCTHMMPQLQKLMTQWGLYRFTSPTISQVFVSLIVYFTHHHHLIHIHIYIYNVNLYFLNSNFLCNKHNIKKNFFFKKTLQLLFCKTWFLVLHNTLQCVLH